jgi:protein gp37
MAGQSAIEWTDKTWNPVTGCDRVSPGCAHCNALDRAARLKNMRQQRYQRDGDPKTSGPGFGLTLHPDRLEEPLRWRKPRRVFVNSMSDLFHEEIPDDYIARVFAAMAAAPQHTFQVLTKRPERMRDWFAWEGQGINRCGTVRNEFDWHFAKGLDPMARLFDWPLPNVWLGVTIENRRFVRRADLLRQTPAAVRFISAEPLLGPLVPRAEHFHPEYGDYGQVHPGGDWYWPDGKLVDDDTPPLDLTGIDWLIAGGESGPGRRPVDPNWVRDLRDWCIAAEVVGDELHSTSFFFKQWGGRTPKAGGRELDGRTWDEFPASLPVEVER